MTAKGQQWDEEYRNGQWQSIAGEGVRYAGIARLLTAAHSSERMHLLDAGCGPGYLIQYVPQPVTYTGLDISAIALAQAPPGENLRYIHTSLEDFVPDRSFSAIVFNEVLYYCEFDAIIPRYAGYLEPHGIILSSVYSGPGQVPGVATAVSDSLDQHCSVLHREQISDAIGRTWVIAAHRPK